MHIPLPSVFSRGHPRSFTLALLPLLAPSLAAGPLAGCEKQEQPQEQPQEDPCPNVAIDAMNGDWIKVYKSRGDHKNRFRIFGGPDAYEAYLVPGFFEKVHMKGTVREHDVLFEHVMTPEQTRSWEANERRRWRMYVEPYKKACSLRVIIAEVWKSEGKVTEKPRSPGYEEFLPFPEDAQFTYEPPDGPLFLGSAARNRAKAEAQVASLGQPDPGHPLGEAIPVGVFTRAEDDGPSSCTYDMDLYFDDQPVEGKQKVPAGEVKGGWRHWFVADWYAPYSGNHNFEMYRYRTCGGERERIGINAIEAVLG